MTIPLALDLTDPPPPPTAPEVCVSATFDPCPQPPAPGCTIDGEPACRDCHTAHRSYDEPVD